MQEELESLELLVRIHAPEVAAALRPPATVVEIERAEELLGCRFPEDLRAAYQWHDGQHYHHHLEGKSGYLLMGYAWMSLDDVVRAWQTNKQILESLEADWPLQDDAELKADQKARYDWWNPAWIPVGDMEAGSYLCVDLAPAPAGNAGQLVLWDGGTDGPLVFAPGFGAHLERLGEWLRSGRLTHSCEGGGWREPESAGLMGSWDLWLRIQD